MTEATEPTADGTPPTDTALGMELAWGLIANAYGGNWASATDEWRQAAERWRDEHWHPSLRSESSEPEETKRHYLNIEEDEDGWYIGYCDCGEWTVPMGCPGPEEVANAWGDHLVPSDRPSVVFGTLRR